MTPARRLGSTRAALVFARAGRLVEVSAQAGIQTGAEATDAQWGDAV